MVCVGLPSPFPPSLRPPGTSDARAKGAPTPNCRRAYEGGSPVSPGGLSSGIVVGVEADQER